MVNVRRACAVGISSARTFSIHMTWTRRDTGTRNRKQNHLRQILPLGRAWTPDPPLGHKLTFRYLRRGPLANPNRWAGSIDIACCRVVRAGGGAIRAYEE